LDEVEMMMSGNNTFSQKKCWIDIGVVNQ